MKKNYQNPISQSFDKENSRLNFLNESNNDHQSILYNQINQSYTFQNNINKLRGGGNWGIKLQIQLNPQIQQNSNLNDIFDEQDIFQYLKYHTILLQRILGNQINQNERDQLEKVVQWLNSKGIINQLSNQCRLDERKIAIIMESIDILLSCVINTPIQLSYNLLQFTQNLFEILYYQDKVIKSNIIKNLHIFSDKLQLINQKYHQQKGLEILFNYQFCLIKDVVDHIQDRNAYNLQKCIFEQNKYQQQNDGNNTLLQDAKKFLQSDNPRQLDIFYFFQQSKLTIIRKLLNSQQIIEIQQIINYLCKVYQLCIQNNQNWRVHLGFLQMLLELISQKNSFLEDLQKVEGADITNIMLNELQNQLIEFQIEDNINIWEHYIKSKWDSTIKCYLAFSFMTIKKSQIAKNVESACQKFIDLFFNSDQDENTISVLKNEQLNVIEEAFEQNLEQNQQTYLYKIYGNTQIEKLQEDFINIDLKVQCSINNDDVKKQQQSNKSSYLFREDVEQCVKQEQIYIVNDFLWTENNNTDVLWIKGIAGSGKSYFLKRLQLFLLKHYYSHSKQKKWIPFLISLDALKKLNNNNIWNLILNADDMEFRNEFIGILSDDLENGLVNIVLLFDGLDEMKHQIQEVNLDISLFQKKLGKNVKIIITSRREVQIEKQFIGLQFLNLTEVEILNLDDNQINEYLKQYCIENTRQYLYNIYKDFVDQEKNSKISRIMFNEYWQAYFFEEVKTLVKQTNNDNYEIIFADSLINNFLSKQQKIFQNKNTPSNHQKEELSKLQSSSKLMKIIKENQIFDLIQTIQILQVILQILPNLNQNITNKLYRKNRFKCNQFFDDFLVEKLDKNIMQISEVDFNLIKNAAKQTQLTKYQIYKLFVSKYYEIYINKLKDSGFNNINESFKKELNKLQMFLAVKMIKHECLLLDTQQVQNIFQSYLNQNNLEDTKNLILLYSTFITKIQNGSFMFQNKSIQEYFVGKYILKLLKDFSRNFTGKSIEQGLEQSQFNQNEFNLSLQQFSQVINDIQPELLNYEDIKKILLKIIILSREEVFIRAASNSILLLKFLRIELIGEDLSRIKLSKTNISGLNVYGSNLDESEFNEVKIDYCNFNNTSLQRVKWTQTPWNEVIVFRDQHQENVSSILFSPNGQFLLSYSSSQGSSQGSSQVNIWELITQKILKKIKYNQNLKYWEFSSDSTKFYLCPETFLQIYCIYGTDITLLITIPLQVGQLQPRNYPFTFYNKEEKLVYRKNLNFYSYNLKSKHEWNKSKIADNSIKLTSIKVISNGKILIGTKDREIKIWDGIIKNIPKTITKKYHQSEIVSLSEETFNDKGRPISLLISASEDQVIVWLNDDGYGYKQVKALHSQKINDQLPRYSIFNKKHLVYIINEYIVLYDLNQINKLEDITYCDSNCIAFINYGQFRLLFIAKEDCIEVYEYLNIFIGKIPLNQCQPLSMDIINHDLMITYNKDNTIRFWSIFSYYQNEVQNFVSNFIYPFRKQYPFSRSRVLQGSIKGFVQNLKQSYNYNENEGTCKVAVQDENENQINIYKVLIFENQIEYHLIKDYKFSEDQKIGCYALCNYGKKICYCVDNIITIKDLQNDDQTQLEQIQEKDIYLIMFSETYQYLASCSKDYSIVIYSLDDQKKKKKNYMINNQKCLDLLFVKDDVLIIQTLTSIIWYKIIWNIDSQDLIVQVFKYYDFEYGVHNGIFQQQMIMVYPLPLGNYNYIKQYLAVKQGENIILKPFINDDQTKVVIFNEKYKKIEFVNEKYIIFSEESSNILEIKNVSDMQVIRKLKYCAFAIRERAIREREYLLIAVETKDDIQVIHILPEQKFTTETIKKQIQVKLHHFTLSNSGYFLASTYNQEITIYYITEGAQIIQISKLFIEIEIKDIQISDNQQIIIQSQDGLYQYKLNVEEQSIYSINIYFGNNQKYEDTRLNHNDKLIALKIDDLIYFTSLYRPQLQLMLKAKFFCTSIDSKYFAIINNNQIQYYDWQDNIKNIYNFDYKQDLFDLRFLQNPNQILAISSNDIQIIQCQENQIKKIKGRYNVSTRASSNLDIAKIEKSIIQISKPEINIELYNPEDYDFNAYNPQFTSDGQYIIYEQNKKVIFQSLSNRHSKYNLEKLEGQYNISVLPESNYLISFNKQESSLLQYQNYGLRKLEYYLNCWDVSDLSDVKNLFKIPILKPQKKKMLNKQWFISEIQNNILCLYDIKEFQQGIYDTTLHNNNQKIQYSGICPNETKYYTVSKEDYSITIWMIKSNDYLKQFKGHKKIIFFIGFSEDEKYMISRDTDQIIVWNLENEDKLIIKDPNIRKQNFLLQCSFSQTFGWHLYNKCDFVKLNNSIGITIQSVGEFFVYDLKDFKSYELFYKQIVNLEEYKSVRHYVYSNGSKIALFQKQQDGKLDKINILNVKSKEIIETIHIQKDERFYGYHNIDKYIIIKIDKEYDFFELDQKNGYIYVCYKDSSLLQLYKVEDFVNEHRQPIKEVFIHLKVDLNDYNSSFIQLGQVGIKYITYFYNSQLRVIDLERYEKQVKIIKLDKSQEFLNNYKQDYILLKNNRKEKTLNIYNLRNGQNDEVLDRNIDRLIVAFKNNGEQLAIGWNDGRISIFERHTKALNHFSIKNEQAIKHILYTKDDKIIISCSQDNVISFWEYQYKKEKLIQSIQIDYNIESIVVSPNNLDIALQLSGGLIQIITIDKQKCWNQNQKYFGCYKSYPQLRQLQTQNCLVKNSIIQDQNGNSLVHHFGEKMKQEFEAQKIQDEQQN
ncbi:unnamed protein product [Paramecium primaurelia]|uniref:NACHT domain-containing protein n=1 Tax=Paramecium primaurelia TaxID=5886 RepID=A0A8S1NBI3_PARPR|nr:unnamed protein product [Paramecium primaurelia]